MALDFTTAAVILIFSFALGKVSLVPLMIAVLMILYGISGIYQPAVQASIPLITEKQFLMQGNAVINMVSTLAGLLGPIIGGVLFGASGIMPILFISVCCFVFSAVMEIFIHIPFEKNTDGKSIFGAVGFDLSDSFQFIKNEKPIFLSVLGLLALFNLILSAMMLVGIPVIVVQILGMSDTALGITQGALGLGGLAGGIIAGAAAKKIRLNVEIPKDYLFENVNISLSTGDVNFFASVSKLAKIKAITGNIRVENTSAGALDLSVTTGKVTVSGVTCRDDITVDVVTGSAYLTYSSCRSVISSGITGSISLNNVIQEVRMDRKNE